MILSQINNFLSKSKKIIIIIFIFFAFSFAWNTLNFTDWNISIITSVEAKGPGNNNITSWNNNQVDESTENNAWDIDNETRNDIATTIDYVMKFIWGLLWMLTYVSSMFLSPEWINGSLFWLNEKFREIWILVSNLVYFVFAMILIWVAFMNIIWSWNEKYQLKQVLPKFVIWILIVPFSWFIVQFILSISAILTIWAVNLPFDTFDDFNDKAKEIDISTECTLNFTETTAENQDIQKFFSCDWKKKLSEVLNSNWSWEKIFSILWLYTYWIVWLDKVYEIDGQNMIKNLNTIFDIIVKIFFDVLFIAIYSILMVALWLVFLVRGIYIWIFVMMSPLFWLMYFFDKNEWWWEWLFAKINIKEFISLAFVPVYAMLALSFWLLFITVVNEWISPDESTSTEISWFKIIPNPDWEWTIFTIWTGEEPVASLLIKWMSTNLTKSWQLLSWWVDKSLGVIWLLIMRIFGIVVLWWAMMAAMRHSEITKAVIEPLHQFGNQVWWIVSKSPQYLPLFGGQSMKSMTQVAWHAEAAISQTTNDKASKFTNTHMPWWNSKSVERVSELNNIENALKAIDTKVPTKQLSEQYRKLLAAYKWNENLMYNDDHFKKLLGQIWEKWWIKIDVDNIKSLDSLWLELSKIESKFDASNNWITKGTDGLKWSELVKDLTSKAAKDWKLDNDPDNSWNVTNWKISKVRNTDGSFNVTVDENTIIWVTHDWILDENSYRELMNHVAQERLSEDKIKKLFIDSWISDKSSESFINEVKGFLEKNSSDQYSFKENQTIDDYTLNT